MNQEFLNTIKSAHFIGIGGIGVSALARMMLLRGIIVRGSDRGPSLITERLAQDEAEIFFGHDAKNLATDADVVIYSPAIAKENPELNAARERNIPTYTYPEALGMVSRGMRTIAVSGTHGKTTTTAMIAEILLSANLDPTVVVGSLLKNSGSNFIYGTSNLFVVEACEYKRSFLSLAPEILVITNIDNDHLDYYGTMEGIQDAFAEMVAKVPARGAIICNPNDERVKPVLKNAQASVVDYTQEVLNAPLQVPGDHNISNAKAALAVVRILGVSVVDAQEGILKFAGTWRRMEHKGQTAQGAMVYDDYAHHPTEIRATLQGFRAKYPEGNIRVIFQPHLYSRTKLLFDDFVQSFADADEILIAPIYAAREENDPSITSEKLALAIQTRKQNVSFFNDLQNLENFLHKTIGKDDVIVTMGAGDIYKIGEKLY